jgi:hypothetical protein
MVNTRGLIINGVILPDEPFMSASIAAHCAFHAIASIGCSRIAFANSTANDVRVRFDEFHWPSPLTRSYRKISTASRSIAAAVGSGSRSQIL